MRTVWVVTIVVAIVALGLPFFNRSGFGQLEVLNRGVASLFDLLDSTGVTQPWVSSKWLKSGKTQGLFNPEPPHLAMLEQSIKKGQAFFEGWYYLSWYQEILTQSRLSLL